MSGPEGNTMPPRDECLRRLYQIIDAQEREGQAEEEKGRQAQLAGNQVSAKNHYNMAAHHWYYKAGMVQAAMELGFTFLELFPATTSIKP